MESIQEHFNVSLEDLITCSICMEQFDSPTALPCLHTFCKKCIEKTFTSRVNGHDPNSFCCPICRAVVGSSNPRMTMNERQALSCLKKNHVVSELQSLVRNFEKTRGRIPLCKAHNAPCTIYRCWEHNLALCPTCLFEHRLCGRVSEGIRLKIANIGSKTIFNIEPLKYEHGTFPETNEKYPIEVNGKVDGDTSANLLTIPSLQADPEPNPQQTRLRQPIAETLRIRLSEDLGGCRISGMAPIDTVNLLLVDFMNGVIKILNTTTKICKVFHKCSGTPSGIAVCGPYVAVSFPSDKVVGIYTITPNLEGFYSVQTIKLLVAVYGLASFGDKIVGCSKDRLVILEKDCSVVQQACKPFRFFSRILVQGRVDCPESIDFNSSGDLVFVTDNKRHSVSCVSLDGKILWSKTNRRLKEPFSIVAINGYLLVAYKTGVALLTENGVYVDSDVFGGNRTRDALALCVFGRTLFISFKINSTLREHVMSLGLTAEEDDESTNM